MEEKVLNFLKNKEKKLCALSTVGPGEKPECSVVGYAVRDDLSMIVSTSNKSRKWSNLKINPCVALVVGWSFEEGNVQYEGTAMLLEEGGEYRECDKFFFSQNQSAKRFKGPDTVFAIIKASWIRYFDPTTPSSQAEELRF